MAGKFALLIGASSFGPDGPAALAAPESDVMELAATLKDPKIAGFAAGDVKFALNAGLEETQGLIHWLYAGRHPDDFLWLYYTGHGFKDPRDGELYLSLAGTKKAALWTNSLAAPQIKRQLQFSASRRKLVVLDCCHSGAIGPPGGMVKRGAETAVEHDTFSPEGYGVVTLTSSTAAQTSIALQSASVYTRHLVEALRSGKAAPEHENLTADQLHAYLSKSVRAESGSLEWPMDPMMYSAVETPLVIARNPRPRPVLDKELVEGLWSEDLDRAELAVFRLGEIARGSDPHLPAEALEALRKRRLETRTLSYDVGKRIDAILDPPGAADKALVQSTQEQIETLKRQHEQVVRDLEERHSALQDDLATAQSKTAAEAESAARARDERDRLSRQLAELQSKLSQEIEAVSYNLASRNRSLMDKVRGLEERLRIAQRSGGKAGQGHSTRRLVLIVSISAGMTVTGLFLMVGDWRWVIDNPEAPPKAGDVVEPAREGFPTLVYIPAGTFIMGSPEDEEGRHNDEGPQRQVSVDAFFMAQTETTFAQWEACVADGGCNDYQRDDEGWGGGQRPVINVSWNDAQSYVDWLNSKVEDSNPFRLPSEAEWEYAARAGTTTRFAFGNHLTEDQANFGGNVGRTIEVGTYDPNAWGLYDMHGNVWEWVQDCRIASYEGAPTDGSAWESGNCNHLVLRGGSWRGNQDGVRAAVRRGLLPGYRLSILGFRVVCSSPSTCSDL
ncbi:MAG: SUMF1/EgtB/PvdO family nonheme iron enzyme [Alphaproteobacteria bacterium]|jgi:formylglycine-generating enzyme required for sulfatase activity|nr:SUMF1/EgtB/PvdO family nonheme iron enzyme [Alphaproteobacteria bacterium]